jgi:hypothetical protein
MSASFGGLLLESIGQERAAVQAIAGYVGCCSLENVRASEAG